MERLAHEAQGNYQDDSDVEVESDAEPLRRGEDDNAASHSPASLSPGHMLRGKKKKNTNSTARYRQKRREEAAKHESEHRIKPISLLHAQHSKHLRLPSFDVASLPAAATGWSGSTSKTAAAADSQEHWQDLGKLLKYGDMQYVDWDERYAQVLDLLDPLLMVGSERVLCSLTTKIEYLVS